MTSKLERLHRSALPLAVRGTLNATAFDMKKRTLLGVASEEFTIRQKNFFKANSRVFMAKGWDVPKMESAVGMVDNRLKGHSNFAVRDLAQQEKGGDIGGRSFIPITEGARTGRSYSRRVKSKYRLQNIKGVIDARNTIGKTKGERFIKSAIKAGVGGFVLNETAAGNEVLFAVTSIKNGKVKALPIYSYQKGRKVNVKATHFMKKSGIIAVKKMPIHFKKEGERQIKRIMNK